jgi:hypothetical protein
VVVFDHSGIEIRAICSMAFRAEQITLTPLIMEQEEFSFGHKVYNAVVFSFMIFLAGVWLVDSILRPRESGSVVDFHRIEEFFDALKSMTDSSLEWRKIEYSGNGPKAGRVVVSEREGALKVSENFVHALRANRWVKTDQGHSDTPAGSYCFDRYQMTIDTFNPGHHEILIRLRQFKKDVCEPRENKSR